MIHVRIALEYRGIPFEIEIEGEDNPNTFDLMHLGYLLDKVKSFIDDMLGEKKQ